MQRIKNIVANILDNSTKSNIQYPSMTEFLNAWTTRDFRSLETMKEHKETINTTFSVDISLENGDYEMFKYLVNNFNAHPSLYSKQMANINGHNQLITFMESMNVPLRNDIGIYQVHYNVKKGSWNECIPNSFRI